MLRYTAAILPMLFVAGCVMDGPTMRQSASANTVLIGTRFTPQVADHVAFLAEKAEQIMLIDSPGGSIVAARRIANLGPRVIIAGSQCRSACAMILVESDNVCLSDEVNTIVFHTIHRIVYRDNVAVREIEVEDTLNFVAKIRSPLREELASLALSTMSYHYSANRFRELYPEKRC